MGQRQGKASGRDVAGPGLSPVEAARSLPSPAGSRHHPRDAGQGHGPFPPIVQWRQGHGFLPVMSPTLTGAGASVPAGCPGLAGSREQSLLQVIPPEFTGLHYRAEMLRQMRNKTPAALLAGKQESDPTAAGVRRNSGDGSNGRFRPPSAAGLGNVQLSVGFVGVVLLPLFTSSTPWKSCWEPKHLKAALG